MARALPIDHRPKKLRDLKAFVLFSWFLWFLSRKKKKRSCLYSSCFQYSWARDLNVSWLTEVGALKKKKFLEDGFPNVSRSGSELTGSVYLPSSHTKSSYSQPVCCRGRSLTTLPSPPVPARGGLISVPPCDLTPLQLCLHCLTPKGSRFSLFRELLIKWTKWGHVYMNRENREKMISVLLWKDCVSSSAL